MKKEYLIINAYINNACKKVHSRHIKKEIKDELYSHLMEHYERQIALGKSDEEAQKIAVSYMGDSETISKTFEKLYKGTEKLISETVWSLFIGIIWAIVRIIIFSDSQMHSFGMGLSLQFIPLFLLRKINNDFKNASIIIFSNVILTFSSFTIYDYFSLPLQFKYFALVASGIIACVTYILIFKGFRETEKRTGNTGKSEICPVISTILLVITQIISTSTIFFDDSYGMLILFVIFATGAFPLAMLMGHGIDILERIDWNLSETRVEDKKVRTFIVLLFICFSLLTPLVAINRPAKTADFAIHDINTVINVTEVREKIISLGLPENIVYELPDSEILKYKDAERMDINTENDTLTTELTYTAYAFYLTENESQPERVRILFIISGFNVYEKLYRSGIYINADVAWESELKYDLSVYDGSFMQILCDVNGEKRQTVPFYYKNSYSPDDLNFPIGCDYGYPKSSENHRIYAAQTVIPHDENKYIRAGYSFYYSDNFLFYDNSVEEHSRSSYSAQDFIDARFINPNYVEPPIPDEYNYDDITSYEWVDELLFENT